MALHSEAQLSLYARHRIAKTGRIYSFPLDELDDLLLGRHRDLLHLEDDNLVVRQLLLELEVVVNDVQLDRLHDVLAPGQGQGWSQGWG